MPHCARSPGQAGKEDFALSNHYDAVLDREQREAALGWSVVAVTDAAGRPEVTLTDRNGAPLGDGGGKGGASAGRTGRAGADVWGSDTGNYVAGAALPRTRTVGADADGIGAGGHDMAVTRRVIVQ